MKDEKMKSKSSELVSRWVSHEHESCKLSKINFCFISVSSENGEKVMAGRDIMLGLAPGNRRFLLRMLRMTKREEQDMCISHVASDFRKSTR